MMPAQRRLQIRRNKKNKEGNKKKPRKFLRVFFLAFVLFILLLLILYFVAPAKWDKKTRLALSIASLSGEVSVAVFDPTSSSVALISLPSDLLVSASHDLGSWRMGSIWKLGQNEKLGGRLLCESITKSLLFPTEFWGYAEVPLSLLEGRVALIKSVLFLEETNLSAKDKMALALFLVRAKNSDIYRVDLLKEGYIEKTKLVGGAEGYRVKGGLSSRLLSIFSDGKIAAEGARVRIIDRTERTKIARQVGEIVEVMGAKVFDIKLSGEGEQIDCEIHGKDILTSHKIASTFNCKFILQERSDNGIDIEMVLGMKFAERF